MEAKRPPKREPRGPSEHSWAGFMRFMRFQEGLGGSDLLMIFYIGKESSQKHKSAAPEHRFEPLRGGSADGVSPAGTEDIGRVRYGNLARPRPVRDGGGECISLRDPPTPILQIPKARQVTIEVLAPQIGSFRKPGPVNI